MSNFSTLVFIDQDNFLKISLEITSDFFFSNFALFRYPSFKNFLLLILSAFYSIACGKKIRIKDVLISSKVMNSRHQCQYYSKYPKKFNVLFLGSSNYLERNSFYSQKIAIFYFQVIRKFSGDASNFIEIHFFLTTLIFAISPNPLTTLSFIYLSLNIHRSFLTNTLVAYFFGLKIMVNRFIFNPIFGSKYKICDLRGKPKIQCYSCSFISVYLLLSKIRHSFFYQAIKSSWIYIFHIYFRVFNTLMNDRKIRKEKKELLKNIMYLWRL